jgi:nitrogen PTS system EIIA component
MQLSLFELAECMKMDRGIVERWIRQGRIPVKRKGDVCIFSQDALEKWAAAHNVRIVMPGSENVALIEEKPAGLFTAITRGGVHYDLPGVSVSEVLRAGADRLEGIAAKEVRDLIYAKLLEREQMMSTGIGRGVAVPHPRTPIGEGIKPQIAACFLQNPVDFQSVDKKPVNVLFILIAPSAKQHLHLLSRISFCLRDASFLKILENRPDKDVFLSKIAAFEKQLDQE